MTVLARIVRGFEGRSAPVAAAGSLSTFQRFGAALQLPSFSGQAVSVDTAMELVPVFSAVSLIAGAVGSLPLKVYRRSGDGRVEASGSRQWQMLHDQPNDEMAADELWEMVTAHLLLWGNAYLWKQRDDQGFVVGLWPIRPDRVTVGRVAADAGTTVRVFYLDQNVKSAVTEAEILHIRGLGSDGLVGLSPIAQARNPLGTMQAQEQFQGTFFKNGMFTAGVLRHPSTLSYDAQERLKAQLDSQAGVSRAGRWTVLEEGLEVQPLTMPLRDAQFIEQAKFQDLRVAQLFGLVPPHRWGTDDASLTYSNTEMAGLDFVKWTLRRWLTRIEQSLSRDPALFPRRERKFCEFLVDALMRGDTKSRYEALEIAVRNRVLAPSEWRALENWAPLTADQQAELDSATLTPAQAGAAAGGVASALPAGGSVEVRELSVERVVDADLAQALMPRVELKPEIRMPTGPAPVVNVDVPRQLPPDVFVQVDMQPVADAIDRLGTTIQSASQSPPVVNVDVPTQPVQLTLELPVEPKKQVTFKRGPDGRILSAEVTED